MLNIAKILLFFVVLSAPSCTAFFEGDHCVLLTNGGGAGKCTTFDKCEYAQNLLRTQKIRPQHCGFKQSIPLVCCPQSINLLITSKSEAKCKEYHHYRKQGKTIAFGEEAEAREFPHMAAIGFGDNEANIAWLCGGSLISDRFVLTAAHCTDNLELGNPKWVRLGDLILNDTKDDADPEDVRIQKIFVHPGYRPPSHYNDIALLKLHNSVKFRPHVLPACIYTKEFLPNKQLQITGWGKTDYLGDASSHLLKADVNLIKHRKCARSYSTVSARKLSQGINEKSQICAGDTSGKDTCPGDSGGPLHFLEWPTATVLDHHVIVGVTSFGKGCGLENSIGVYTRVSFYKSWIEEIVWPNQ